MDRRIQRTRMALQRALVEEILACGYEQVTVQQILDRAGIARATFYAHYRDKESLLRASLDNLRLSLERMWLGAESSGRYGFVLPFLRHLDGHRHVYRAMLGSESELITGRMLRRMLLDFARTDLKGSISDTQELEARSQIVSASIMGLAVWWIESDVNASPEEVRAMFLRAMRD